MPDGTDLAGYSQSLLERFSNPALHHRTWQIAMDGSQKLPQRLLGTVRDRLQRNLPIDTHALAIAGWMRYVTATDEQGGKIDVRDPHCERTGSDCEFGWPGSGPARPPPSSRYVRCSALSAQTRACARRSQMRSPGCMNLAHNVRCRPSRSDRPRGSRLPEL